MKLLLDTHIWLWSLLAPEHLTRRVAKALESPHNELWLSPLSTWELLVLVERGRIVLDRAVDAWLSDAMGRAPLREAPLTHEVALETRRVRLSNRDPIDTFLVATARVLDLTLLTADEQIIGTKGVSVLANR
ncbi:MAG: type II toxin-antitoxin system VapC family toxin [Candidatus Rokubacteria bacterium]|nr:type II toxin-antitoxin system VapC family toxin [Candidatus Rokubacteria bacterium]